MNQTGFPVPFVLAASQTYTNYFVCVIFTEKRKEEDQKNVLVLELEVLLFLLTKVQRR